MSDTDNNLSSGDVNAAIAKVLRGGQMVTIGQRQLTRANLGYLMQLRREAVAEQSAAEDDPNALPRTFTAAFDRR